MFTTNVRVGLLLTIVFVCVSLPVAAQQPPTINTPKSRTKFETESAKAGLLLVSGLYKSKPIAGADGTITVYGQVTHEGTSTIKSLAIVVMRSGSDVKTQVSYVDSDELQELISALDSLGNVNGKPTALDLFLYTYHTKGGLFVEVKSLNNNGEINASVASLSEDGTGITVKLAVNDLSKLRDAIEETVSVIKPIN